MRYIPEAPRCNANSLTFQLPNRDLNNDFVAYQVHQLHLILDRITDTSNPVLHAVLVVVSAGELAG
eukprot:CAMPEP_0198658500 /NCGR_PEP_ID=MMETSP1467-20131203/25715_1 /TAXON_ID=1462469 /ORGANISM="unid. sp., Strain CCMP2135" /LENGTH=65 /DNA_ID=CAMNT_0044394773 /DNA_START=758 /DNA_END=955 /DNA_ORIENTATION=-